MYNIWHPVPKYRNEVTSRYGPRDINWHNGIDFATPMNTDVFNAAYGVVVRVYEGESYGNYVIIDHDGFSTLYAHLSKVLVEVGDTVEARDVIALTGNSGKSTGPHLHFEIRDAEYTFGYFDVYDYGRFQNSVDPEEHLPPEWKEFGVLAAYNAGLITTLNHTPEGAMDNGTMLTILLRIYKESK